MANLALLFMMIPVMEAGWLAAGSSYWSCMGACCSGAAAGGLMAHVMTMGVSGAFGAAACATVCSSLAAGTAVFVPGLCFADGTRITRRDGNMTQSVFVEQLRTGDEVLGAADGVPSWLEVLSNDRRPANTSFMHFTINTSGSMGQMIVTEQHLMFRVSKWRGEASLMDDKYQLNQFQRFGWSLDAVRAGDMKLGDLVPTHVAGAFVLGELVGKQAEQRSHRNTLSTAGGSVVADGVLTATACEGPATPSATWT